MEKGWILRRNGRRLEILDPDTLEERGFIEVPEGVTAHDLERFREWLMKQATDAKVSS
jgi:hypothetical protein